MKFLFLFIISSSALAIELKTFETDGCTMFVDGTKDRPNLWQHCCLMHDMKYWYGGTEKARDKADIDLKNCVENISGEYWANLIYTGVRLGHYSPVKHKYNWSWGWSPVRNKFDPLASDEVVIAKNSLQKLPYDKKYIDQVLKESFSQAD